MNNLPPEPMVCKTVTELRRIIDNGPVNWTPEHAEAIKELTRRADGYELACGDRDSARDELAEMKSLRDAAKSDHKEACRVLRNYQSLAEERGREIEALKAVRDAVVSTERTMSNRIAGLEEHEAVLIRERDEARAERDTLDEEIKECRAIVKATAEDLHVDLTLMMEEREEMADKLRRTEEDGRSWCELSHKHAAEIVALKADREAWYHRANVLGGELNTCRGYCSLHPNRQEADIETTPDAVRRTMMEDRKRFEFISEQLRRRDAQYLELAEIIGRVHVSEYETTAADHETVCKALVDMKNRDSEADAAHARVMDIRLELGLSPGESLAQGIADLRKRAEAADRLRDVLRCVGAWAEVQNPEEAMQWGIDWGCEDTKAADKFIAKKCREALAAAPRSET